MAKPKTTPGTTKPLLRWVNRGGELQANSHLTLCDVPMVYGIHTYRDENETRVALTGPDRLIHEETYDTIDAAKTAAERHERAMIANFAEHCHGFKRPQGW